MPTTLRLLRKGRKFFWNLGVEGRIGPRIALSATDLRQLFDVIGADLRGYYGDDSETTRLQEENIRLLGVEKQLNDVMNHAIELLRRVSR